MVLTLSLSTGSTYAQHASPSGTKPSLSRTQVANGLSQLDKSRRLPLPELMAKRSNRTSTSGHVAPTSPKNATAQAVSLPYHEDFNSGGLPNFIVLDNNDDYYTWENSQQRAEYIDSYWNDADDWLLTPLLQLEGGHTYEISYSLAGNPYYTGRYAVAFGEGQDPDTYTYLLESTEIAATEEPQTIKLTANPETTGEYRFGFHALSPMGYGYFSIDDIHVEAKATSTPATPDSVTELRAKAGDRGALSATVSFKAPTISIKGETLTALTKIELTRNGELIHTFDNPSPGEAIEYPDETPAEGINTYTLCVYSDQGQGLTASTSTYVGFDTPGKPLDIYLDDNLDGTARLHWKNPGSIGVNGGYVDASELTYALYYVDPETSAVKLLETDLAETEYLVSDITYDGDQTPLRYLLRSVSSKQEPSAYAESSLLLTGKAYGLPYIESFSKGVYWSYWIGRPSSTGNVFEIVNNISADNDLGSAQFKAGSAGETASMSSGKIGLAGYASPRLSFSYYAVPGTQVSLTTNLLPNGHVGTPMELNKTDYSTLNGEEGWREISVDLTPYQKQCDYMRLSFVATVGDASVPVRIDAIKVAEDLPHNLAISLTSVPATVRSGKSLPVKVKVENYGREAAQDYRIGLYVNGERVEEAQGTLIQPGQVTSFDLNYAVNANAPEELSVYAVVDYAADLSLDNNTTTTSTVAVKRPDHPAVSDLHAAKSANGVTLTWSRPNTQGGPTVEDFESYDAFTLTDFGNWTAIDRDGTYTYAMTNVAVPHQGWPSAFEVFNPYRVEGLEDSAQAAPYSGEQYLVSFSSVEATSDNWLISTPLNGQASEVSVMAKAWTTEYGNESFEILYSTTDSKPESFTLAKQYEVSNTDWQKFSANLPEGAKYFALRGTSHDRFMLLFDDLAYVKGDYELTAYNIYRNSKALATIAADATTYTDATALSDTDYTYNITAVYTLGESVFSNSASTSPTGIGNATSAAVKVTGLHGSIAIEGAKDQPVRIYTADGRQVLSAHANSNRMETKLPAGFYLVKVGENAFKTLVF